jgi:DNA-binding MarR family transcriptional regulator
MEVDNINEKLPAKQSLNSLNNFDLWLLLDAAHYTIARSHILELVKSGITKEQARILHVIKLCDGSTTLKNISEVTKRQHNSVSTIINRMVNDGLILKIKNPGDKVFKIMMTKKAQTKYNKATYKSLELIFSSLSLKQQQQFACYLEKVRQKAGRVLDLMSG